MQIMLGSALIMTRGSAAPEVEQTYAHARALCQQLGETPQLLPTLRRDVLRRLSDICRIVVRASGQGIVAEIDWLRRIRGHARRVDGVLKRCT